MTWKKALITGITGQDGSYLAELLLEKEYEVHGIVRRVSTENTQRIAKIKNEIVLHDGDMTDTVSINKIFENVCPDEIYNLAAQSFVASSWIEPINTMNINACGTMRLLEAMVKYCNGGAKFYQASTSEMFGNAIECPQNEETPFCPESIYGTSKLAAHHLTINYMKEYGIKTYRGILFNHESPRRGNEFVTKRIASGVADVFFGRKKSIVLGNMQSRRDWGYAPEYVEAMWLIMSGQPSTFVVATGETHTVQEFFNEACDIAHISTECLESSGYLKRKNDVNILCGNASKIEKVFEWKPKVKFKELVKIMVEHEITGGRNG